VNRTPETFGQKLERERLEAETTQNTVPGQNSEGKIYPLRTTLSRAAMDADAAANEMVSEGSPTFNRVLKESIDAAARAEDVPDSGTEESVHPSLRFEKFPEVWHLGNYAKFESNTVTVTDASGKAQEFHFPGVIKSVASKVFGLEVKLEDGRLFAIAGGPSLLTMFPLSMAGLIDDEIDLVGTDKVGDRPRSHAPRDPDLKEFKEQVLRAFKHLGLDTRKFFS